MVAANHKPLPKGADKQYGGKYEVYQLVGNEYDAERDDNEAHGYKWTVDAEGTS